MKVGQTGEASKPKSVLADDVALPITVDKATYDASRITIT